MSIEVQAIGHQTPVQAHGAGVSVNSSLRTIAKNIEAATIESEESAKSLTVDPTGVAVEEIQKFCDMFNRKLQFRVNKDTNRVVIKVIDSNTDKVIREIPSEAIQKLQASIRKTAGLVIDKAV